MKVQLCIELRKMFDFQIEGFCHDKEAVKRKSNVTGDDSRRISRDIYKLTKKINNLAVLSL